MNYILDMNGRYYFNRRVPNELREFDARPYVRFALKTDSFKEASRLAANHNFQLEKYWKELVNTGAKHSHSMYEALVKRCRLFGFTYTPVNDLANGNIQEIITRLFRVEKEKQSGNVIDAVLGKLEAPLIKLDDALLRYFDYSQETIKSKSPNQLRKWKRPRERAVENFIKAVGNKPIIQITRNDLLVFKDWWLNRIYDEELGPNGANKNFIQLKMILETVSDNMNLKIDIVSLFRKITLKEDNDQKRLPLERKYIQDVLLNADNLSGLNEQARNVLYAIAETGAGPSEQVGLLTEDIILDAPIPHIIIRPRERKGLKTKYRKRTIPLVGHALDVFKAFPNGFTDYRDRADSLSSTLSKYLRENNLLPSEQHSVYSLRHTFQDTLLALNAPDRVQTDLMGHKFSRQAYGNGSSLEQKHEFMIKGQLKRE